MSAASEPSTGGIRNGSQTSFPLSHSSGLGIGFLLLLFAGTFGHNLFRYTWVWYAAFLVIARQCAERQAVREAGHGDHRPAVREARFAGRWPGLTPGSLGAR